MSYIDEPHSDTLMHYGVKGMKWGKRKAAGPTTNQRIGRMSRGQAKEIYKQQRRTAIRNSDKRYDDFGAKYASTPGRPSRQANRDYKQSLKNEAKTYKSDIRRAKSERRANIGPSQRRQVLLGILGNKKDSFSNPKAHATRVKSGRNTAVGVLAYAGGRALSGIGASNGNSGLALTGSILQLAGSGTAAVGTVQGFIAVSQEKKSRK